MITDLHKWAEENGYSFVWQKDENSPIIAVLRNPFNTQIIVGDEYSVNERYTYESDIAAILAFTDWMMHDGAGEPVAWIRHQPSNRRREGGDPATETVRE